MKIAVVGAGSLRLTADLIRAVCERRELGGASICLLDVDAERLGLANRYARRLAAESGGACAVEATMDNDVALRGADFVIATVTIGGASMRLHDVQIPRAHGIVHLKGDTTGPAGIFRALRGIPFLVDLGRHMERVCPEGVLLNLSNPLAPLTRAVLRETSIRAAGICSCVDDMRLDFAAKMQADPEDLVVESLGVNHFTWMTGVYLKGRDAGAEFEAKVVPHFRAGLPVTADLYDAYGRFPIPGYKYASEFFPHFLGPATNHGRDLGFEPADPNGWEARAAETHALFAQDLEDTRRLPSRKTDQLMDIVAAVMVSMASNRPAIHTINTPNAGRMPTLPPEAVVEGPVYVAGDRLRPLFCGRLPTRIEKLLERVVHEQELVVEAAVKGDRELVFEAFLMDPLVCSPAAARSIIEGLLLAEREYLPRFRE